MNEIPTGEIVLPGDILEVLSGIEDESFHMAVTSPPYLGLRDYKVDKQIGREKTPQEYVARLVEVFREVRRVLRKDGTFWLNIGDCYSKSGMGLRPKNLVGIPWRVALALQDDGWNLRNEIIWCLSSSTELYVRSKSGEGPMLLKDMVRLDSSSVQVWNGEKWVNVLGWSKSNVKDGLLFMLRSGQKFSCTGEHKWPTNRGLVKASELKVGDELVHVGLPEPENPVSPLYIPDDVGWFVGLYLAEGSRSGDGNGIQIASNVNETERFERLCSIAKSYGGTCNWYPTGGNSVTINLYSRFLLAI